jgi:ADP-ribose 1''-phosphate phosphatase
MGKLIYEKMSLFDAPAGSIIVHACNAQGMWGSGIAKEFAKRYPESYKCYSYWAHRMGTGRFLLCSLENYHQVGCLITSKDYGPTKDSPGLITYNTVLALEELVQEPGPLTIYSNKFNSGLFDVPWEVTELVLKGFVEKYDVTWTICDPSLGEK